MEASCADFQSHSDLNETRIILKAHTHTVKEESLRKISEIPKRKANPKRICETARKVNIEHRGFTSLAIGGIFVFDARDEIVRRIFLRVMTLLVN